MNSIIQKLKNWVSDNAEYFPNPTKCEIPTSGVIIIARQLSSSKTEKVFLRRKKKKKKRKD